MSTFNEIEMTTPYGDTDNVLELNIDSSSDAYVLQDVIKLSSTYTFSIWYRTESDSQITFNVLGESEIVDSTTSWNKFVKTVTVETLDETSIYILPSVGVNSYFYEGYLVEGITDTSWTPAPEDIESEIGNVRSELVQTADSILARVSASDGRISTLETNLEGITGRVEDAEGNISKVTQTVDGITTEISDAKGSSTTLQARLEGIDTSVVNAETSAKSFATQEAERIQSVVQNNIDNVESNINQRADNIELSVAQKENIPVTAVRYIRDWLNGIKGASSIDNKWVECDVITHGTNIASGIIPTYKNSSLTTLTVSNPEYYTDEILLDEALERYINSTENSCLEIDLGEVYYNIDYIRVWHYYEDNRVYNHKMQISTDGISWVTIYDSDIAGGYAETSYGKVYYLNNAAIAENITSLNISSNQIESRVENIEGNFSSIKEQADKIESIVGSESEDGATGLISSINNLDNLIVKLRSEYEQYKSDSGTSISTLTQTMNEITSRIATVEGNTRDISEIRQDAKGWQALFAQLDMYDMPEITTNISIDINGITVTNPTTKQQTRITIDEFSGWYNNEKIFWIDKDTTKTRRLLCEKGWDTGADFIKMTTNSYTYSDGRTLNGVAYVKSGGSS